jgi:hypothetical protein
VSKEFKVFKVKLVPLALKVSKAKLVQPAHKGHRETQA